MRANEQTDERVAQSVFLAVFDHSALSDLVFESRLTIDPVIADGDC